MKAAGGAAASTQIPKTDPSTQHSPAALPRKPRKAPSVAIPAFGAISPMGGAAGHRDGIMAVASVAAVQEAAGKRLRVPSAKGAELLAMQADASYGRRRRSRAAPKTQQHQELEQDNMEQDREQEQEEALCADAEVRQQAP